MRTDKKLNIKIEQGHYYFKILINDLPHFVMPTQEKIIFNSWNDTDTQCYIQFLTSYGTVKLEYDSISKWKQILKALNEGL